MYPSLIIIKDNFKARMLQDGVRGNNYLHRKNWIKVKKKAQLQALC